MIRFLFPDTTKEKVNGVLDLPDEEPEIVARTLMYIYTGTYKIKSDWFTKYSPAEASTSVDEHGLTKDKLRLIAAVRVAIAVHLLADRWDMESLKTAALQHAAHTAEYCPMSKAMLSVVEVAFERSASHHSGLRALLVSICGFGMHRDDPVSSAEYRRLPEKDEPVAFRVMTSFRSERTPFDDWLQGVESSCGRHVTFCGCGMDFTGLRNEDY